MSSHNQENINNCIEEILIESLISGFELISADQSLWDCENFENYDYHTYIRDCIIHSNFNEEHLRYENILDYENKSYNIDYRTFLNMCKYVKNDYDRYDNDALAYITEQIAYDNLNSKTIIKIHRNIFKIEANKKKHSGLINLYEKLDKKNKK